MAAREEEEKKKKETAFSELWDCPCSFQVSPSALAPAKVTAVIAAERTPDASPPSVLGASPGRRRGEEKRGEDTRREEK